MVAGTGTGRASGSGETSPVRRRRAWWRIFLVGGALWSASLVTVALTGNPALVPTLILLGSFLVPVTFVAWAFETWRDEDVTTELIVVAFVVGGLLGCLGAGLLESYLLYPSPWLFLGVGLIEEAAKLVALLTVTRRMARRHTRDGVVLGAAVGFGFAAFESAGYAFQALLSEGGSLPAMVETELLRGAVSPLGHGLWTAILGGVVFSRLGRGRSIAGRTTATRVRRTHPLRSPAVIGTFLLVAVLHALWDAMHSLALLVTVLLTASPRQGRVLAAGALPRLTAAQDRLLGEMQIAGLAAVSIVGIAVLAVIWNRSRPSRRSWSFIGHTPRDL